jgi:hypothetical protein
MSLPLLTAKTLMAQKIEATIGTAIALANTEAVPRIYDGKLEFPTKTIETAAQGAMGTADVIPAGMSCQSSGYFWLAGKGGVGLPASGDFWRAAGFSVASQVYTASSDQSTWKTLTQAKYTDGRKKIGRGMMFNLKLSGEAGQPIKVSFEGMGGADIATPMNSDTALLTGISYESVIPPILDIAATLTLDGSVALLPSKWELDLGNDVQLLEDPNSPGGYLCGMIRNRKPKLTIDPAGFLYATKDWYAKYLAATNIACTIVAGATSNNIITIAMATMKQNQMPQDGDRNGVLTDNLNLSITGDGIVVTYS